MNKIQTDNFQRKIYKWPMCAWKCFVSFSSRECSWKSKEIVSTDDGGVPLYIGGGKAKESNPLGNSLEVSEKIKL